jgi:formylglycine-generating enzyme required for sulfatase activity
MFRIIGVAVVLALTGGLSFGQDVVDPATVAAVDPNAPTPTDATVVSQCTTMANDLSLADRSQGVCITAANGYIAALAALPAQLAPDAGTATPRDAALNDMVGKIAQLTQDNVCDERDEELAAAVDAAAAAADAEETRTTLVEIARTIREVCTDGTTAALTDGSPADANLI